MKLKGRSFTEEYEHKDDCKEIYFWKPSYISKISKKFPSDPAIRYGLYTHWSISTITGHIRRHQPRLKQYYFFHVHAFIHSFFPSTNDIWNKLPNNVVNAATIDEFKTKLTHDLLCNNFNTITIMYLINVLIISVYYTLLEAYTVITIISDSDDNTLNVQL